MPFGDQLAGATLVVAHPDDEVLWFSSILQRVGSVLVCFSAVPSLPDRSAGRARALAAHPLSTVQCLGLAEAESFLSADWRRPVETGDGLRLRRRGTTMTGFSPAMYGANAARLRQELGARLAGVPLVVTHNPWGEYGHEDHVQVFRVLDSLRSDLGFRLGVSGYVSPRSLHLFEARWRGLGAPLGTLATDRTITGRLRDHYRAHGCWTWYPDYDWPDDETLFEWVGDAPDNAPVGSLIRLNMIRLPVPDSRTASALSRVRSGLSTMWPLGGGRTA